MIYKLIWGSSEANHSSHCTRVGVLSSLRIFLFFFGQFYSRVLDKHAQFNGETLTHVKRLQCISNGSLRANRHFVFLVFFP